MAASEPERPRRNALRWTAAGVLLTLFAVLAITSVLAGFAHRELLDTDRYVQTVTPLPADPALREVLADRATDAIMDRVDVQSVTAQALAALADSNSRVPRAVTGLAPLATRQTRGLVRDTAESVLASDRFEAVWIDANRQAHRGLVAVLTGEAPEAVGMDQNGAVSVALGPLIDSVRSELTERGFTFAEEVPSIDWSVVIFRSPELVEARRWVTVLDRVADVLPWITVLVAAGAIWVAPGGARRRALTWLGVTLALAMALLAVAIGLARSAYLDAVPADVLPTRAAAVVIDAFLAPLDTIVRAMFALAVAIMLAAQARRVARNSPAIRAIAARYRVPLRIAVIATAATTLTFWSYPTATVVIMTVLAALAALLVVELAAGREKPDDGDRPGKTGPRHPAIPPATG
ncbi:hypothetical protein ACFRAQ_08055 [Nocardia sp. NPDC056611]|uniref:hypothetical protein n=1 Tax=Nocardia sp. NPDC056611 TaxID=3345877 RepID=UPI003671F62B